MTSPAGPVVLCAVCGEPAAAGEAFCESCGAPLEAGPGGAGGAAGGGGAPGGAGGGACARCGAEIDGDGYCVGCGRRAPRPGDHTEVDLGPAAGVTDRGLRHSRNEDAMAIAVHGPCAAAVVCDGVSSSADADRASAAAAAAAIQVLRDAMAAPPVPAGAEASSGALRAALDAARDATAGLGAGSGPAAPSTTLVAALVTPGQVSVVSVGDSRAYLLADGDARQLTIDDSWAEAAVAAGMDPGDAQRSPQAHVITRWLGADGDRDAATVASAELRGDGVVVVCSDGLWNYFPTPGELSGVLAGPGLTPLAAARRGVEAALGAGGHDNVTVVVIQAGPAGVPEE